MTELREAVIVSAVRSPVGKGKKDGALASVHPTELSAWVMRAAVQQAGVDPTTIDDIFWGCAMPEASQGLNVARLASLRAGFPVEVPSATINRFCSSGLQTIALAAQQIMTDMGDIVIAGGVEMMSQVPMSGYYTRLAPELTESYIGMGFTAERVAQRWTVSREDQDRWAVASQQKAAKAWERGAFSKQIAPIPVTKTTWQGARKEACSSEVKRDELLRPETTIEGLAKLKPAFMVKGTVTAGNSSPYSDGAAALVLMSRERA
ncbi:MAG TPA: thiolase family protein, partial [Gemmatimonadaceae bacterium]|nr:thiolase family protein [Gemmatimonadaceae bacterium]